MISNLIVEENLTDHRIIKPSPDGRFQDCWYWTRSLVDGYGQIRIGKRMCQVHRVSAEIFKLKDPNGNSFYLNSKYCVLHKCDNRACFNPNHFFIGTQLDNLKDCINKCRKRTSHNSKMNREIVNEIRKLFNEGWSREKLKNHFNISYPMVCQIISYTTWK